MHKSVFALETVYWRDKEVYKLKAVMGYHFERVKHGKRKLTKTIIDVPAGFIITKLTTTQLKKLNIPTVKIFIGERYHFVSYYPKLGNLISIEHKDKAEEYEAKKSVEKHYSKDLANWLSPL